MQITDLGRLVGDELSGSVAKSYVAQLTDYHRIQASPMMQAAAEHVRDRLSEIGVDEVEIVRLPADGQRRYWTHLSTLGWDVRSAELRLVDPEERLLASYSDTPQSLHTLSKSTPRHGVSGELVDVGKGTSDEDYSGKDVEGRFVLATGRAKAVQNEAVVKRGAIGVITDSLTYEFPGVRESKDVPDAHAYQGLWPDAEDAKKIKFGFSLSRRQGNDLRRHLTGGVKVRLHATVDADIFPGKYSIVAASIRGASRPDEEIFISAHLCHPGPGANDNASGSGLLLEIARTITALVESGRMKRPSRTIRFLWVPETTGTVAYLSECPDACSRLLAGINLDMVGEDQQLCRSTLCMDPTPDSLPSFVNDLVYSILESSDAEYDDMVKIGMVSNFRHARTVSTGGSDQTEFTDSSVGVPCVALTQWPDLFYHTSLDTIDKVSEDSLRRAGWTATVSALVMADADDRTVHGLASLVCSEGMKRISDAVGAAAKALIDAPPVGLGTQSPSDSPVELHRKRLRHIIRREQKTIGSVSRLDEDACCDEFVERQVAAVTDHGERESSRLESMIETLCDGECTNRLEIEQGVEGGRQMRVLVPTRNFKGSLDSAYVVQELGADRCRWYDDAENRDSLFSRKTYEAVNLMDGRRSIDEIMEFVSAEFGHTDSRDILKFLDDLKEMRLISMR